MINMAAQTWRLCAVIVLICIIVPTGTGFLMPSDTVEKTGYELSNPINVTSDLTNSTEPYETTSTTVVNNEYILKADGIGWAEYVKTGDNRTSLPNYSTTGTRTTLYTPSGYSGVDYTIPRSFWTSHLNDRVIIPLPNGTVGGMSTIGDITSLYYNGGDQSVEVIADGIGLIGTFPISEDIRIRSTMGQSIYAHVFARAGYADPGAGWYVPAGNVVSPGTGEGSGGGVAFAAAMDADEPTYYWTNLQHNKSVDYVIRDLGTGYTVTIAPTMFDLEAVGLRIVRTGSNVTATDIYNGTVHKIGNYKDILVRVTPTSIQVSGLTHSAGISDSVAGRIVNLVDCWDGLTIYEDAGATADDIPDTFGPLQLRATAAHKAAMYCVSSTYMTGAYAVTRDNGLDAADYFPEADVTLYLRSIAKYGDTLSLPNYPNLPVVDGTVTINGEVLRILDMHMVGIYDAATSTWSISADGIDLGTTTNPAIWFGGLWSVSVYIYKTTAYTYESFEWAPGSFNLDSAGFCAIGLATSAAMFVFCGLYGRRAGGKIAAVTVVAGLCGLVYLIMLMEV